VVRGCTSSDASPDSRAMASSGSRRSLVSDIFGRLPVAWARPAFGRRPASSLGDGECKREAGLGGGTTSSRGLLGLPGLTQMCVSLERTVGEVPCMTRLFGRPLGAQSYRTAAGQTGGRYGSPNAVARFGVSSRGDLFPYARSERLK
jgi:hypothetical protein